MDSTLKTALVFPGQASQVVGMGRDLYQAFPLAKKMFDTANEIVGYDLADKCFNGPLSDLTQTRITQPAIYTVSSVLFTLLKKMDFPYLATAGHSLGEYCALYAAGVFSFEDGLRLVNVRGKAMQIAGEQNPGAMAAILKLEREKVEEACQRAAEYGRAQIANINSPGQIVISGDVEAVQAAMKIAKELGATRAIQLDVSGAFHSHLMAPAKEELEKIIVDIPFYSPNIPVYCNVNGEIAETPDQIRRNLIDQIENPVLFVDQINRMIADGFERFIEVGPGKVLQGLIHRINPDVEVKGISGCPELQDLCGDLAVLEHEE
ncbi:TPA: [acyl-carrier-protein] S-malonyltransferase [Candidatus Marinimicrobia bacterium]|nr:MAG: Malonyl CoA-acyl carrier protein transacylase [Marinimicrobia bacterium 46_47]KUK90755.1 MAG: malonyl CoA-acyl carrier protein transacylase [Marinimicrobia bacterium 46_43]HAE86948.1 [acyl-carrier-protein] S-malonyltransferase [Candidatus Neomarinimicrobiota bacterium]HBY17580.1 [acyl-carrier-protein] S-malonyltransferase [Candidatus Neomarinimicrobiota bacterium]